MKYLLLCLIFIITFNASKCQEADENPSGEIAVYNQFLNSLYNIGDCQRFITPPFFACCNFNQHMAVEDHVSCCLESDIPERYRIYCQECINIGELDTLEAVIEVVDTLYPIDFDEYKEWILENVHTSSGFYGFISEGTFDKDKLGFNIDELKQVISEVTIINKDDKKGDFSKSKVKEKQLTFLTKKEIESIDKKRPFGKLSEKLMLGRVGLSRVYFNETSDKAFFYFAYLGTYDCGFENVVLIEKTEDVWKIAQTISISEI